MGWFGRCRECECMVKSMEQAESARSRAVAEKRDQMARADRAECDLSAARSDVQRLNQRAADDAKRVARAAGLLDEERAKNEKLWAENVKLRHELDTLRKAVGNARNQLDGRRQCFPLTAEEREAEAKAEAAFPTSIEVAECAGA